MATCRNSILKGDADVNAALEEVNRLIAEANVAVEEAKKTASEGKRCCCCCCDAAAAVESIENKEARKQIKVKLRR